MISLNFNIKPFKTTVYLALGSNLFNPISQIKNALYSLSKIAYTNSISTSSFYLSSPYGNFKNQPDFVNAVTTFDTFLTYTELFKYTKRIEYDHKRYKTSQRWGPRTIDIDILLFGNIKINTSYLTIPHYDMYNRDFVLLPLLEIAPSLILPNNEVVATMLDDNKKNTIKRRIVV